jgi:iron complex transport system substrate-binding protein
MRSFLAAFAASLLIVACGSGDDVVPGAGGDEPRRGFPVSIRADNGLVTLSARPERIVSLSPSSTEMLFAIEAGDQVAAVDDQSDYPPEAPTTELSGLEPNVEAIASHDPDLVLVDNDTGDIVDSLNKLEIPVIVHGAATTFDDVYTQIEQLGVVTGHVGDAAELVARMRADVERIVASVPELDRAPTYYHELDPNYFTATSDTFIGQVYALLGLRNIADRAKGAASGYPQLSAEYIIQADPDLIFLADTICCDIDQDEVESRPGWDQISAVKKNNVVELDDDVASRWGPRVIEYLRTVADAVIRARAGV